LIGVSSSSSISGTSSTSNKYQQRDDTVKPSKSSSSMSSNTKIALTNSISLHTDVNQIPTTANNYDNKGLLLIFQLKKTNNKRDSV
jgi:hypothetical protein